MKNIVVGDAENRNWRLLNYDEEIASKIDPKFIDHNKIKLDQLAKQVVAHSIKNIVRHLFI